MFLTAHIFANSDTVQSNGREYHVVDSATIQSQVMVFDLGTTAFLTNWENGLSNFPPCLEWPATALSGRGCRPECQRVHIGEENDKGRLKHVLRCKTSVSVKRYTLAFVAAYLPAGCRAAAARVPVPKTSQRRRCP